MASAPDPLSSPHGPPGIGVAPDGYRIPGATRLGMVRLQQADLARSLHFYTEVLGFRILVEQGERVWLGAADDGRPLVELVQAAPPAAPAANQSLGLYHFAVLLPTRAALGRMLRHLQRHELRPGTSDHGFSESLYLRDPSGLGVEIYADQPRDQWVIHEGQVGVKRAPLDEADLLQSGGGEPWEGLPPGSSIGHIHLRIGDLDAAETLYHRALGFDRMYRDGAALMLAAGGYHHHLALNAWGGSASTAPAEHEARLLEWELILPSAAALDGAVASLADGGYPAKRAGDGDASVVDPWGNRLRLAAADGG